MGDGLERFVVWIAVRGVSAWRKHDDFGLKRPLAMGPSFFVSPHCAECDCSAMPAQR
jgi:hypothetical protein